MSQERRPRESVVDDIRRKRVEQLFDEAIRNLAEEDYVGALETAQELEKLNHPPSFEIVAQAHVGLGNKVEAVKTLERGIARAPDSWGNWQLLGNWRSDLGRYDQAERAYDRALSCRGAAKSSVRLNQAILASRRGRHRRALTLLEPIDDPDLRVPLTEARIHAFRGAGQSTRAAELAQALLGEPCDPENDGEVFARVAATLGRIRLEQGAPKLELRRQAVEALEYDGRCPKLLALIRDIDALRSAASQYFRLVLHGRFSAGRAMLIGAHGFYVAYDVVAETKHEALELVRPFERDGPEADLAIEEAEVLGSRPEDPKGVYRRGVRHLYEQDDRAP